MRARVLRRLGKRRHRHEPPEGQTLELRDLRGQPDRGMDQRSGTHDIADLVRLQMTDEVPARAPAERLYLLFELARPVLAEVGDARLDSVATHVYPERLRDRHEGHVSGGSAGPCGGR